VLLASVVKWVTVPVTVIMPVVVPAALRVGDRVGGNRACQSKEYSGNEESHCLIQVCV
jgi:hypothetical protein